MSSHADTLREALHRWTQLRHAGRQREVEAALDALLAENQQLREALRNAGKLAADILRHQGHDDILVCLEEAFASARAIQHYAVRAAVGEE